MKQDEPLDHILKQALTTTVQPSEELNQKVRNQWMKGTVKKPMYNKKVSVVLIAAVIMIASSITALAATYLYNARDVAERLGDSLLAEAFTGGQAIVVNESIVSGDYRFTLQGIVSGEGLSDFEGSAHEIHPERTYAVVSIEKQDGSNMPSIQDDEYGNTPFFISPLIKGQKPWQVNISTMNGSYSELVLDGVMYRLIEIDGIDKFADRGVYLAISTSHFYDVKAFHYDEETGEISRNLNYDGANALFELPLDISKADPEAAEQYLQQLLEVPAEDAGSSEIMEINWEEEADAGEILPESIKEVTYLDEGMIHYAYDGNEVTIPLDGLFQDGESLSHVITITETNDERIAIRFSRDDDGTVKGIALRLN